MKLWIFMILIVQTTIVKGDLYCYICKDCEDIEGLEPQLCKSTKPVETSTVKTTTEDTESSPSISTGESSEDPTTLDTTTTTGWPIFSTDPTTPETSTTTGWSIFSAEPSVLPRSYRSISHHACISITIKGNENNGRGKVNRDCLEIPSDKTGCEYYLEQNHLTQDQTENCKVCDRDGCNGSAIIRLSVFSVLFMVASRVLY